MIFLDLEVITIKNRPNGLQPNEVEISSYFLHNHITETVCSVFSGVCEGRTATYMRHAQYLLPA